MVEATMVVVATMAMAMATWLLLATVLLLSSKSLQALQLQLQQLLLRFYCIALDDRCVDNRFFCVRKIDSISTRKRKKKTERNETERCALHKYRTRVLLLHNKILLFVHVFVEIIKKRVRQE